MALSLAVTLVITPQIVARLGASAFGLYGLFVATYGFVNLMALGEATLYFSAREDPGAVTRALALWHLAAGIVGVLLIAFVARALGLGGRLGLAGPDAAAFEGALTAGAALWATQFYCNWLWNLCRARLRFTLLAIHQALLSVAAPLFGLLAAGSYGLNGFLWASALAWGLGTLALLPFLRSVLASGSRAVALAELLRYGRWTIIFGISVVLMQSADRLLVAGFGAVSLAGYALASSLYQRAVSAFGLLPTLLTAAVSRMQGGGELERAKRAYGLSLRFTAIAALAVFLPLWGLGDVFLNAWLPQNPPLALMAYAPLRIFCAAGLLASLSGVLHAVLLGLGYPRQVALTGLVGAAFGFSVAWLCLPSLGLQSAALSGLVGYASVYALRLVISERRVFGRKLGPLALEHGLLFLFGLPCLLLLRNVAPYLNGCRLLPALSALALAAALVAALALAADQWMARRVQREPVLSVLKLIWPRGR